jgi:hypothetical protein
MTCKVRELNRRPLDERGSPRIVVLMNSDSSAIPPSSAADERRAVPESHYQDAVGTLRQLDAKAVFVVLEDVALGRPVMGAAGLLVVHEVKDDVVDFMIADEVEMAIWRDPPMEAGFSPDWMTLKSAGMRLTLGKIEPPSRESIEGALEDLVKEGLAKLHRDAHGKVVHRGGYPVYVATDTSKALTDDL